jgi:hypothetical protein
MFKLYYDHLLPHFGERMKLLYTDTDSLVFVDKNEYMKNKGVIGRLKLECGSDEIIKFGVCRPKQYFMETKSGKKVIKAKDQERAGINARDNKKVRVGDKYYAYGYDSTS